jgi:acylphosphatase
MLLIRVGVKLLAHENQKIWARLFAGQEDGPRKFHQSDPVYRIVADFWSLSILQHFHHVILSSSMPGHPHTARLYLVRGRVQGVGYRDYAQRVASALGVTGYVRNLDDGRVEVYAAGPPDKLSDLSAALRKGPRFSDVRGVDEQEAAPQRYSDFQIEV